ncbi:MAG TPA: SDR family oxidoreductase [Planctomycetaceae bacterium]|jgi:dihydroanticapsin dehydrogenase|nr:SDR family oxidoreductase [Planctomycetaceae bacterium]
MSRFDGKVAVVTGGGSGIGRATCLRFAEEGASVVVAEIDEKRGQAAAVEIRGAGKKAIFVRTDVADESSVRDAVTRTAAEYGRIDILVNSAAVFVLKGIDATVEEWRKVLDVNVMGSALMAKHVVPHLRKAGGGAIVNLGSISSFIAQPQFVTYNTTKTAILGLTRCLALDLAPDNIRVNAVCPGAVWTPIVMDLTAQEGMDRKAADASPQWGGAHMIKRIADPREIANAILFLASSDASFVTAESLMVDGGYVAQ